MSTKHTLSVLVENTPGILARIAALFSRRGFNIDSLAVGVTEHPDISRITIVVSVDDLPLEQVTKQLNKLVNVLKIVELEPARAVERELVLVKVVGKGEQRLEAMRLATAFGARTLDATLTSFIFELTATTEEVERFIGTMTVVGLVEVSRTGVAAMSRGAEGL